MINYINLKKYVIFLFFILLLVSLIVFSSSNFNAAKYGLILWANSVVPSLFPFFVATDLLSNTQIPYILGRIFNIFMKPIFNVQGEAAFSLIMGIISGYPVGAKIACNFREKNILSKEECERLLSFTNNSGPMFILGTVGISMFGNSTIGLLLLITHILGCLTVGFIFRFWKNTTITNITSSNKHISLSNNSLSNLGDILSKSISNSISTLLLIGGFVVLFSVIISIFKASRLLNIITFAFSPYFIFLNIPSSFVSPFITGIIEITNGISLISTIHVKAISINIILTSFLLGFGGISIFLQVLSIVSKTDLSIKPYFYGKILHGFISAFYTFLFIKLFPMFNFNL